MTDEMRKLAKELEDIPFMEYEMKDLKQTELEIKALAEIHMELEAMRGLFESPSISRETREKMEADMVRLTKKLKLIIGWGEPEAAHE